MTKLLSAAAIVTLAVTAGTATQAQPPPPRRRVAPARTGSLQIVVRDQSGTPLADAHVVASGPTIRETTTNAAGTATLASMRDGSYRLRFERDGFITLERDVTLRNGQPAEIAVALNLARPAPSPAASSSNAEPSTVSIPGFQEKNSIGRDPLKESVLGCTESATTRLLQLRDPLAGHAHANLDETLYVVAGEGAVLIRNQVTMVSAGSLTMIPRGVPHAIERRGKNPLVLISMLSGAPCQAGG